MKENENFSDLQLLLVLLFIAAILLITLPLPFFSSFGGHGSIYIEMFTLI